MANREMKVEIRTKGLFSDLLIGTVTGTVAKFSSIIPAMPTVITPKGRKHGSTLAQAHCVHVASCHGLVSRLFLSFCLPCFLFFSPSYYRT